MATSNVIMRRPVFELQFITEETSYQIKYDASRPEDGYMNESIVSVHSKNALEDDTAAFTIVLTGDREWDKVLHENDLVILNIDPNEQAPNEPYKTDTPRNKTVVMGLISEVRIEGTYADNSKMYRVTGQSFQKAFANFELRSVQQAGHVTGSTGWLNNTAEADTGFNQVLNSSTITGAARELVSRFKEYMKYNFRPEGDKIKKAVFEDFFENKIIYAFNTWEHDEFLQNPIPITSFEGSLNQLIKDVAEAPFVEYFFDVFPTPDGYEKVWMIIRRTPFDKEDWVRLNTYVVRSRDVIAENIGRNDMDAYSIFNVVPAMESENLGLMSSVPWFNESLVAKYGYKMLEVSSKFLTIAPSVEEEQNEALESNDEEFFENSTPSRFGKKLYEWYANNPIFYSGDITVVGHPDYRIGNRLVYKNSDASEVWEFYVESVEHSFSYEEGYTTKIGLTRGLRVKDINDHGVRFTPTPGKPERFRGGLIGEMSYDQWAEVERKREAEKEAAKVLAGNQEIIQEGSTIIPANTVMTSPYGGRIHPVYKDWRIHTGVDIAPRGNDSHDVRAMSGGKVVVAKYHPTYGNMVEVNHSRLGGKPNVSSLYAHLASINVTKGQLIPGGFKIGVQGKTGTVTGLHLHFEVRVNGKHVDPETFVDFSGMERVY